MVTLYTNLENTLKTKTNTIHSDYSKLWKYTYESLLSKTMLKQLSAPTWIIFTDRIIC